MISFTLTLCFFLLIATTTLSVVRLLLGPRIVDRIIAFDLISASMVGIIVLLSIRWETPFFIEIMLIFSLLGFFGTVAFVYYLYSNPDRLRRWTKERKRDDS